MGKHFNVSFQVCIKLNAIILRRLDITGYFGGGVFIEISLLFTWFCSLR
jgi:hypothetical protein